MPRKLKSQDGNPYEIIRGMWEGAYVSHFLRLFQKRFGFNCLTTQDLEEALVDDESVALADIIARLLRYVTGNTDILIANFDTFLKDLLIKEDADFSRFLHSNTTWQDLTPEEKEMPKDAITACSQFRLLSPDCKHAVSDSPDEELGTLKWLIDHVYKEKDDDVVDYLDENYSADDLRGICAGQDAFNNVYWYLDDLRLYREFSHKKQNKKDWECVCLTLSDWQSFIKQFRKTSNVQEKELYSYLNFELFPFIEPAILNKLRKVKRSKEEVNIFLINEERKDLEIMLEKKTFLDCNNTNTKSDINGSDTLSQEKNNGTSTSTNSGNSVPEFHVKTDENCKNSSINFCDGHISIGDNICSINNNLSSSVMDIKSNSVANMCSGSCATSSSSTTDVHAITSNGNISCGSGINCTATVSGTAPVNPSMEGMQEVNLQQSLSDIPSDSSSVTSNKENAPPSAVNNGNDITPISAIPNMVGSAATPATTASVQPLPSNMVNKTSFQMETQYMQQQSQIFVFSTALANKAAESCLSGNFPTIIAFHCAQPGTKSFLEKYPLKVQQFNRQNPAAWLNSLAQMKQPGGRHLKTPLNQYSGPHNLNNRFPGSGVAICSPCTGACNMHSSGICPVPRGSSPWPNNCASPSMMPPVPNDICPQSWPSQQLGPGMSQPSINHRYPGPIPPGLNPRQMGPAGNPMMGTMGNMNPNNHGNTFSNSGFNSLHITQGPGGHSSLAGVKVPDENLTEHQRQHRREQLAMIRKMQQLLFPEQQQMDQAQGGMVPNMGSVMGGMIPQHASQSRFGHGDMCVHTGMEVCYNSHQPCMNEHEHSHPPSDIYMESHLAGPGFPQQNFPPVSASAQLEWQKLQHQFYEERRKKQVPCSSSVNNSSPTPLNQNQTPVASQTVMPVQSQPSISQPPTPQQQLQNSPSPSMGLSPGPRIQGPPPPYHQSARRTMSSPHPASPNTSSLSLSSPRMASGLPSPADPSRQFPVPTPPRLPHPSPGSVTPVGSNSLHTTPLNSPKPCSTGSNSNSVTHIRTPTTPSNTASTPGSTPTSSCAPILPNSDPSTPVGTSSRKQNQSCSDTQDSSSVGAVTSANSEFSSSTSVSTSNKVQGELFGHNMHLCSQPSQKQDDCANHSGICQKEPSLMPVPSPQQIQYLNTFDGQELTIQKQPNNSIRELDMMSPTSMPPSMVLSGGSHSQYQSPDATSFPNTPGSCPSTMENSQDSLAGRYPSSAPASMEGGISRFMAPSPQMPGFESAKHMNPASQTADNSLQRFPSAQNMEMLRIPGPSSVPHSPLDENGGRFSVPGSQGPVFGPAMNNMNLTRFSGSASEAIQRLRGPNPHANVDTNLRHSRFFGSSPHMACMDNISQSSQFSSFGSEGMPSAQAQSFCNSVPSMTSQSSPCIGNNFIDSSMSHSHLQNLQKMTPPFENVSGNKMPSGVISPLGQCTSSSVNISNISVPPYGETSPLTPSHVVTQRLSHFDPIASMAAMSESTVPMVSNAGNAQSHQNIITSNMDMTNMQITGNPGNNQTSVGFHTTMQNVPSCIACSISNPNPFSMQNQMVHNIGCGQQTANNTYVNATMSIQQLNAQNIVTTASYNPSGQRSNVTPLPMHSNCQGNGSNTLSCSVTTNHPIMHTSVTTRTSNTNMGMPNPRHGPPNFTGHTLGPRNAPQSSGSPSLLPRGAPFNSANIQVKANAPNTIQYLPARQQNSAALSNRPPSLEFLQRFAAPLTNLDNKVPTHNLQYFPNSGVSNPPTVHNNVGMNQCSGTVAPGMMSGPRPVNMMMGPMMRATNSNAPHPGGQMFPVGSGLPSAESPMFGRSPCPSMGNPMVSMSGGQGPGMYPNKQLPLPMGGMTPDTTQPLPPSMGQSFNYKQSPFYGPTTADPNYAVQFHNFQQQLYATNTRSSQINSQGNVSSQGFFGPK